MCNKEAADILSMNAKRFVVYVIGSASLSQTSLALEAET
jgi:hypothetical protein